jgi:C-terminal processing protease CtpA/Prc
MAKQIERGKTEILHVKPSHTRRSAPLFILIDSYSASASEMLARDEQIRKRAGVIGDNSSGRVNVARIFWEKVGGL